MTLNDLKGHPQPNYVKQWAERNKMVINLFKTEEIVMVYAVSY